MKISAIMSARSDLMDTRKLWQTRWSLLSRLKNWSDDGSWQDFFDTYWELLYSVAIKSGLTDAEAQDVVQETLVTVAKNIAAFRRDAAQGSFKAWLLHTTRWKIMDQFRKRPPGQAQPSHARQNHDRLAERIADSATFDLDAVWDKEWKEHLLAVALENVKQKVSPQEVQIFDLCVWRQVPVKEVAQRLKLKLWKVYFAQKRIAGLLKREVKRLENTDV